MTFTRALAVLAFVVLVMGNLAIVVASRRTILRLSARTPQNEEAHHPASHRYVTPGTGKALQSNRTR